VAKKHGLTLTELALGWCTSRPHVASSIIGATSLAQLKQNIAAFDVQLSAEAVNDIDAVHARFRDPAMTS